MSDTISGTVIGPDGEPVENAVIKAVQQDGRGDRTAVGTVTTNANGEYNITVHDVEDSGFGPYHVIARYEEDGQLFNAESNPFVDADLILTQSESATSTVGFVPNAVERMLSFESATSNMAYKPSVLEEVPSAIPDSVDNHWPFDEGSGSTAEDDVGSADMSLNGLTYVSDALAGSHALEGDGVDDYGVIAKQDLIPADSNFTFIVGVKTSTTDRGAIIGNNDGQTGRWDFDIDDGTDTGPRIFADNAPNLQTTIDIRDGSYHEIAWRREGDTWDLIIDGTVEDSVSSSGTLDTSTDVYMFRTGRGRYLEAILDEPMVAHGKALTDSEIADYPFR